MNYDIIQLFDNNNMVYIVDASLTIIIIFQKNILL